MEIETQKRIIEGFGISFGEIILEKNAHQKELRLTIKIKPSSNFEIRTSSFGPEGAQFTFKEKE